MIAKLNAVWSSLPHPVQAYPGFCDGRRHRLSAGDRDRQLLDRRLPETFTGRRTTGRSGRCPRFLYGPQSQLAAGAAESRAVRFR
jgi:hypothetical protein